LKKRHYLTGAALLFVVLVAIARFADGFLRGFIGDIVVIGFLYLLGRGLTNLGWRTIAVATFLLGALIEISQLVLSHSGIHLTGLSRVVFGSTFDPLDLLAYAIGAAAIVLIDTRLLNPLRQEER
jgi:hypothetical protein